MTAPILTHKVEMIAFACRKLGFEHQQILDEAINAGNVKVDVDHISSLFGFRRDHEMCHLLFAERLEATHGGHAVVWDELLGCCFLSLNFFPAMACRAELNLSSYSSTFCLEGPITICAAF